MKSKKYKIEFMQNGCNCDISINIYKNGSLLLFDDIDKEYIYLYPKQVAELLKILEKEHGYLYKLINEN